MPDLEFSVESAAVVPYTVAPTLGFRLRVANTPAEEIVHSVVLRCQIQLEVNRRRYTPEEEQRLGDLFGDPRRWSQTLRTMLWTHVSLVLPAFTGCTVVELPVPCTWDFNVATTKYFGGLTHGEIPLSFLFSGSVFYQEPDGRLQVAPISWTKEAAFRLPVATWQQMMDAYYPNTAWLQLRRDVFNRLYAYKVENAIPTWEQVLERVLRVEESSRP
jgi:hypothetical protein